MGYLNGLLMSRRLGFAYLLFKQPQPSARHAGLFEARRLGFPGCSVGLIDCAFEKVLAFILNECQNCISALMDQHFANDLFLG